MRGAAKAPGFIQPAFALGNMFPRKRCASKERRNLPGHLEAGSLTSLGQEVESGKQDLQFQLKPQWAGNRGL